MIDLRQLDDLEQKWSGAVGRLAPSLQGDVLSLIETAKHLRDLCRQVIEADDEGDDGCALMGLAAAASKLREEFNLESKKPLHGLECIPRKLIGPH